MRLHIDAQIFVKFFLEFANKFAEKEWDGKPKLFPNVLHPDVWTILDDSEEHYRSVILFGSSGARSNDYLYRIYYEKIKPHTRYVSINGHTFGKALAYTNGSWTFEEALQNRLAGTEKIFNTVQLYWDYLQKNKLTDEYFHKQLADSPDKIEKKNISASTQSNLQAFSKLPFSDRFASLDKTVFKAEYIQGYLTDRVIMSLRTHGTSQISGECEIIFQQSSGDYYPKTDKLDIEGYFMFDSVLALTVKAQEPGKKHAGVLMLTYTTEKELEGHYVVYYDLMPPLRIATNGPVVFTRCKKLEAKSFIQAWVGKKASRHQKAKLYSLEAQLLRHTNAKNKR